MWRSDQRCLIRNGSTQRSTVGLQIASKEKRMDEVRSCLGNTSSSLHSRGSSMLSMTGNWNWSSTGMNGRRVKGPSLFRASLCCNAAVLERGFGAECPIVSTGIDCSASFPLSVESQRQHLRSIRPAGRCQTSEESSGEAHMRPDPCIAAAEDIPRQVNCPADWKRNLGNLVGAASSDLVGAFSAIGLEFSEREDVGGRMSNVVLRQLCFGRFTPISYRQELSSRTGSCFPLRNLERLGAIHDR